MPMTNTNRGTPRRHIPLAILAALLILLIAGLAGVNLWYLVHLYEQTSRSSVTFSVLQHGTLLTRQLSRQKFLQASRLDPIAEDQFNMAVDMLQHIEPNLAYITVTENDVVIYHKQTASADGAPDQRPANERTSIIPKRILTGTNVVPVIAFTRKLNVADGRERHLQVALKKDIVAREQAAPSTAIAAMFNMSLVTLGAAFGICLLAVIWLVRRELKGEQRRRQNEHLAFAGAVAESIFHDFRNTMSPLNLDAQMLQQEAGRGAAASPGRLNELAERITATVFQLDLLLAEHLVVAKPEVVEKERFDINTCLSDNMDLLKPQFEKEGLRIDLALSEQPLFIRGYPVQFTRALLNVLKNAEHFSPKGGTVAIRTRIEDSEAVVKITDEGPGIAPRDRRRIFDLFYSNRPGGTGIGLALTKTAVENCGGTVEVKVGPNGKGSCFVIRVPLV